MYELAQRGLSLEQLLQARGMTQDAWIQEMMGAGLFEARLEVLYKSIALAEDVMVDEKEVETVIKTEAKSAKMKPKQLRKQMEKNGALSMLEYNLLMEKLHSLLLEKADVKYVAPGSKKKEESKKGSSKKKSSSKATKEDDDKAEKSDEKAKKSDDKAEKSGSKDKKKPAKAKSKSKDENSGKSKDNESKKKTSASKTKGAAKKSKPKAKKASKKKS